MIELISNNNNNVYFSQEVLRIIPITQYDLKGQENERLNHSFNDIPFFPK